MHYINVVASRTHVHAYTNDTFMQEYGLLQVSNARHRADLLTWFSRSRSSHLTVYFFSTFVPGPRHHGDRRSVALALATITMQVGVVNRSISAYPLLSAYFPTTYAYKRMRLITRVYGTLFDMYSLITHQVKL